MERGPSVRGAQQPRRPRDRRAGGGAPPGGASRRDGALDVRAIRGERDPDPRLRQVPRARKRRGRRRPEPADPGPGPGDLSNPSRARGDDAMTTLLELSDVTIVTPAGRPLFDGIRMRVGRERVALIGRNGVGKSSLLAVLAGDAEPHAGRVTAL